MPRSDVELRGYLLGTLPEEARAALEAAYFDDDDVREQVECMESTLIDDYVTGALDAHDRAAFEHAYRATPARWARVETARALLSQADARAGVLPRSAPIVTTADPVFWRRSVLTGLAAAAGIVLALWQPWRTAPGAESASSGAPAVASGGASSTTPAPATSAPSPEGAPATPAAVSPMLAVVLTAGLTRDNGDSARVELPPNGAALRLALVGDGPAWVGRDVSVRNVDTGAEWRGRAEAAAASDPTQTAAVVVVPAGAFSRGDFVVAVAGDPAARFVLRVR